MISLLITRNIRCQVKGAFPYSNLDEQLAEYNELNGVYFSNGKRVELSELQATGTAKETHRVNSPLTKAKLLI